MKHTPVDIPVIAGQISDLIFTSSYTADKQLTGLQSVRWLAVQQKLIVHKEEGFRADGTN